MAITAPIRYTDQAIPSEATWNPPRSVLRLRAAPEVQVNSIPKNQGVPLCILHQQKTKQIPSGYVKIAIENDHRNSGFSH